MSFSISNATLLALTTALISGVSVFVNKFAVGSVPDPILFAMLKKIAAPHFSFAERVKIETYLAEQFSKREIARRLKREPASVRYEIRKNSVRNTYTAEKAQLKAEQRRWRAKWQVLKVAMSKPLKEYVNKHVRQYWSPESIAGRIRYVDKHLPRVGKDAIYAYLESTHGRPLEKYLWWKGKKRRATVPRVTIDGRTMIDKRPKSVETRDSYGHWEGDFIVSGKSGTGALLVLVERKSRYCIIRKLPDRKVSTVNGVLAEVGEFKTECANIVGTLSRGV